MVLPLSALLRKSVADYRAFLRPILVGAVVFGLLLGITALQAQKSMEKQMGTLLGGIEGANADPEEVQELIMRMQQGGEGTMSELGELMEGMEGAVPPEVPAAFVGSVFAFILVMWSFYAIGSMYYLVVAVERSERTGVALRRTVQMVFPLIGLSIWIGIRSFMWIPFIGVILGIVFLPRFLLSPVLLLRDGKGVLESARLSYERTRGYWGKIVGNSITAVLCGLLAYIALTTVLSVLSAVPPFVVGFAVSVLSQLLFAYFSVFTVALAVEILENPSSPTKVASQTSASAVSPSLVPSSPPETEPPPEESQEGEPSGG